MSWISIEAITEEGWYIAKYEDTSQPYRVIRLSPGKKRYRKYSHSMPIEVWDIPIDKIGE